MAQVAIRAEVLAKFRPLNKPNYGFHGILFHSLHFRNFYERTRLYTKEDEERIYTHWDNFYICCNNCALLVSKMEFSMSCVQPVFVKPSGAAVEEGSRHVTRTYLNVYQA